jgi:hypothetical protein
MNSGTYADWLSFWSWAADKGQMNVTTARARRVAIKEVGDAIGLEAGSEIRDLDLDDALRRFENLRSSKFTPGSLSTYKSRVRHGHAEYLAYLDNPSGWKPSEPKVKRRVGAPPPPKSRDVSTNSSASASAPASEVIPAAGGRSVLMDYPFPIRDGVIAVLKLPIDLTEAEAERLGKHLQTLALPD